jgi:outer membrane lipoprotein LolB
VRRLAVALFAVALSACATVPPARSPDPQAAWQARHISLARLSTWTVTGRVLIKAEERSWNATLFWVQRDEAYRIRLIAPLGQGTVQLSGGDGGVVRRTSNNQVFTAQDPQTLMLDTLGWSVPVDGLRYWMRGLDDPRTPAVVRLDARGRPETLEQAGWVIDYQRYADGAPPELPTKLALANQALSVRILVSRWELDKP